MVNTPLDTSHLNMDFHPHYLSGCRIRVEFPDTSQKTGKVGVTQSKKPEFVLISKADVCHTLGPGCTYLGPALRKTRIDTIGYLTGKIPTSHLFGDYPKRRT